MTLPDSVVRSGSCGEVCGGNLDSKVLKYELRQKRNLRGERPSWLVLLVSKARNDLNAEMCDDGCELRA